MNEVGVELVEVGVLLVVSWSAFSGALLFLLVFKLCALTFYFLCMLVFTVSSVADLVLSCLLNKLSDLPKKLRLSCRGLCCPLQTYSCR